MNIETNDEALRTRIIGLVMMCFGICLIYLNHYQIETSDSYYPMMAFIGPLLIAMAVIFVIEAPKLPLEKPSFFGWICLLVGGGIGLWNALF